MIEKQIINKFYDKYGQNIIISWKSPSFKYMRWDIFGVFDLIVIFRSFKRIEFIQITTLSNLSARRKKIQAFFKEINYTIDNSYIYAYNEDKDEFIIEKII